MNFLLNNDMPRLTSEQKEACDKPINESEILKSINIYPLERLQALMGYHLTFTSSFVAILSIY